jgi:hypothetical protein
MFQRCVSIIAARAKALMGIEAKRNRRIAVWLPVPIITLSACSGPVHSPSRPSATAPPKPNALLFPPAEPRGPRQDLSRKLMERNLTGARLVSIGDDTEWSFTEKGFVLQAGKMPISSGRLEALLGPGKSASRIEWKWRLEDAKGAPIAKYVGLMVLTEIRGDGKDGRKEARLETQAVERHDVDGIRLDPTLVNIAGCGYRIEPGKP